MKQTVRQPTPHLAEKAKKRKAQLKPVFAQYRFLFPEILKFPDLV
jgi:hypothetical protein